MDMVSSMAETWFNCTQVKQSYFSNTTKLKKEILCNAIVKILLYSKLKSVFFQSKTLKTESKLMAISFKFTKEPKIIYNPLSCKIYSFLVDSILNSSII